MSEKGFLQRTLEWAIQRSDPSKLSATAAAVQADPAKREEIKVWADRVFPNVKNGAQVHLDKISDESLSEDDKCEALETLEEFVHTTDQADLFAKVGGIQKLLGMVQDQKNSVRVRSLCAWVIATSGDLNPNVQQVVLTNQGLNILLTTFRDDPNIQLKTKCLLSISGLIRSNPQAAEEFVRSNGLDFVFAVLATSVPIFRAIDGTHQASSPDVIRLIRKICFMFEPFCKSYVKGLRLISASLPRLLEIMRSCNDHETVEMILSLLNYVADAHRDPDTLNNIAAFLRMDRGRVNRYSLIPRDQQLVTFRKVQTCLNANDVAPCWKPIQNRIVSILASIK